MFVTLPITAGALLGTGLEPVVLSLGRNKALLITGPFTALLVELCVEQDGSSPKR